MSFVVANTTGGQPEYLNPKNWHPGDAHVHSHYSKVCIDMGFALLGLWKPRMIGLPALVTQQMKGGDLFPIDGRGELSDISESARRHGLSWLCMTEHGPNLGMPAIFEGCGQNLLAYNPKVARLRWEEEGRELSGIEQQKGACNCMIQCEELSNSWRVGHLLVYNTQNYLENRPYLRHFWSFVGARVTKRFVKTAREMEREYLEEVMSGTNRDDFCYIAHPMRNHYYSWEGFDESLKAVGKNTPLRGFELLNGKLLGDSKGLVDIIDTWDRFLADGYHVRVIGGSDAHKPYAAGASAKTFIYAEASSFGNGFSELECDMRRAKVLSALKYGNSVVSDGPLAVMSVTNLSRNNETATSGDILKVLPGDRLRVNVACGVKAKGRDESCNEYHLISSFTSKMLWKGSQADANASVNQDKPGKGRVDKLVRTRETSKKGSKNTFLVDVPGGDIKAGYLRVEGRGAAGTCYTNPVFLKTDMETRLTSLQH